jgi:lipoprotein-releasing system ATP-binding protein
MDNILLRGENLIKDYGKVVKSRVLGGVNISLKDKEFASLIGPSGCGKSTLLNLLGALDKPTEGNLYFKDKEFSKMNKNQLAEFRNRNIGFIFQSHHLLPEFTALENVLLPAWISSGKADKKNEKRAIELLDMVGLKDKINNLGNNLSGGQQQRVSIARSLINNPDLVLADEPTGNLDSESSEQAYDLLRQINNNFGIAFLIVTHDRHIADKSNRIIEMKDGLIINDTKKIFSGSVT